MTILKENKVFLKIQRRKAVKRIISIALQQSCLDEHFFQTLKKACNEEGLKLNDVKSELCEALSAVQLSFAERRRYILDRIDEHS